MVLKPGNHSVHSRIIGMNHKRFEYAAKVSGEIFINRKLNLGEKIYQSASKCFNQLGENYNLGIILLCAPIVEISTKRLSNLKVELNSVLSNINEFQGSLILKAIKQVKPAGLLKYDGPGDVGKKKKLMFKKIMEIGSKWDRISKCYINNYSEVLDEGLPFFEFLKKKTTSNNAIILLYLFFLSSTNDSHIFRKYGHEKARMVTKKAKYVLKKIILKKKINTQLLYFDKYLKRFHYNPGTCADLTVTTLLISKIRDIFKFQI